MLKIRANVSHLQMQRVGVDRLISCSKVICKVVLDGVLHYILLHRLMKGLLDLVEGFQLEDGCFLLEKETHCIQGEDLQGFCRYDPVHDIEYLLDVDVADVAVEYPGEDELEGLDSEFGKVESNLPFAGI